MGTEEHHRYLLATASAIIERVKNGKLEVLLQTRWKPQEDPMYSGTYEIPGGRIERGETPYDALRREVREETGLEIKELNPNVETWMTGGDGERSFAFVPFCGEGFVTSSYIGLVFLCKAEGRTIEEGIHDAKHPRWVELSELKDMIETKPELFFPYHLGALRYYVNQVNERRLR